MSDPPVSTSGEAWPKMGGGLADQNTNHHQKAAEKNSDGGSSAGAKSFQLAPPLEHTYARNSYSWSTYSQCLGASGAGGSAGGGVSKTWQPEASSYPTLLVRACALLLSRKRSAD